MKALFPSLLPNKLYAAYNHVQKSLFPYVTVNNTKKHICKNWHSLYHNNFFSELFVLPVNFLAQKWVYTKKTNVMKKILVLFLLFVSCKLMAQTNTNRIIVKAGMSFSTINQTPTGNYDAGNKNGFTAGVTGDFQLSERLFIQPSVFYASKGFTATANPNSPNYFSTTVSSKYIEAPVTITYKLPISEKVSVFAGGGIYLATGIGGKYSDQTFISGKPVVVDHKIEFVNAASYDNSIDGQQDTRKMMRFDAGIVATSGIEIGRIVLTANYGYGLTRINAYKSEALGYSNYNRTLAVTAGFKF